MKCVQRHFLKESCVFLCSSSHARTQLRLNIDMDRDKHVD